MKKTPEIETFLTGIEKHDSAELKEVCVKVIDEMPEDEVFNTFIVRTKARTILMQPALQVATAQSNEPFNPSID